MSPFPGPRDPLHHFAGREDELAALAEVVAGCSASGAARGIRLITGVPGAGKTTLLGRFLERVKARGEGVRTVTAHASDLAHPLSTFIKIAEAAGHAKEGRLIAEADTFVSQTSTCLAALSAKATASVTKDRRRVAHPIGSMLDALAERWNRRTCDALIFTVDELQNVDDRGGEVMRVLHEGSHGCPILFLGAGLQHTPTVLAALGVSRVPNPIELHVLSMGETREAFVENAAFYAGVADFAEPALVRLVEASQCFPMHVHGYLEGVVRAARSKGPRVLEDDEAVRRVVAYGDGRREAYYDARLDAMDLGGRSARNALLPLTAALVDADSVDRDHAAQLCDAASLAGSLVVDEAIRHGVLTLRRGMVGYGIPSFEQHMARLLRERTRNGGVSRCTR